MPGKRENMHKLYLDMDLTNTSDGFKVLHGFRVMDGCTTFEIDRQEKPRLAASIKAGGNGMLYRCYVTGVQLDIFHEIPGEDYVDFWYVAKSEAKALLMSAETSEC